LIRSLPLSNSAVDDVDLDGEFRPPNQTLVVVANGHHRRDLARRLPLGCITG